MRGSRGVPMPSCRRQSHSISASAMGGRYDEDSDSYLFEIEGEDEGFIPETIETEDGEKKTWPIGSHAWTWVRER